jgi:hypothetical protein
MITKQAVKQFFCGVGGHGLGSLEISDKGETLGSHTYCPDCKKTLGLFLDERLTLNQKEWLLNPTKETPRP